MRLALLLLLMATITGCVWVSGSHLVMDPELVCKKSRRLHGKLANICRNETALLQQIVRGVSQGTAECGYQFRARQWNCSTSARWSMRKILMKDTRETAFVNAITAAGVTYAITRACTAGELVQCSCERAARRRKGAHGAAPPAAGAGGTGSAAGALPPGEWQWSGCEDNVRFGHRKSRDFMDARYRKRSDIKTLIKLHNNNAGRLAIRNFMRPECKCHGVSGSCTMQTCWLRMPPFREIGDRLKDKFDGASKVIAANDGKSFMPEGLTIKPPEKMDLVYSEDSPDFCRLNHKTGSLGTQGRSCNAMSQGVDGCDLLCCNRGYSRKTVKELINCKCIFNWCCNVTCEVCVGKKEVSTCL